jgi:hypothetical protein
LVFRVENSVYTHFSEGKSQYILIFPGGTEYMLIFQGGKLVCNTGSLLRMSITP